MSECVLDAVMNDEMDLEMGYKVDDGLSMVVLQGCRWKLVGRKVGQVSGQLSALEDSRPV